MTTLIVAALAVAALVWLVFENAALHDALNEARADRDDYQARAIDLADRYYRLSVRAETAEAVECTWPFAPALVDVTEPIHDGVVLDFCRDDVGGDAS